MQGLKLPGVESLSEATELKWFTIKHLSYEIIIFY